MKLFAPEYYNKFVCIADKCAHSCCVGWEIDVDDVTAEKYNLLGGAYAEKIRESIDTYGDVSDIPEYKEIYESYWDEEKELTEYRKKCAKEGLELFVKWFYRLTI